MSFQDFLIEFRSNAKQTKKDIEDTQKASDNLQKSLNDSDDQTQKLANSVLSLGLKGLAAFAGFQGIKAAIKDTVDFNFELRKNTALTGEASRQLTVYESTFQRFGVSQGAFTDWFVQYSQYLQKTGGDVRNVLPNLRELSKVLKDLPEDQARQRFQQVAGAYGLPQEFFLALRQGPEAIDKAAQALGLFNNATEQTAKLGFEAQNAWSMAGTNMRSAFTDALPAINLIAKALLALTIALRIVEQGAAAAFNAVKGTAQLLMFNFHGAAKSYAKIGGNATEAAKLFWKGGQYLDDKGEVTTAPPTGAGVEPGTDTNAPRGIRNNNPGNLRAGRGFASFPTLAAGLQAEQDNLRRYGRRGWDTLSQIGSHWAPPNENNTAKYISDLARNTGFNPNERLDLSDPSVLAAVANAINKNENGAAYGALASGPGGAGSAPTINIGELNVHTQAADADGISKVIVGKLNEQYRTTVSNFDDGVAR